METYNLWGYGRMHFMNSNQVAIGILKALGILLLIFMILDSWRSYNAVDPMVEETRRATQEIKKEIDEMNQAFCEKDPNSDRCHRP